MCLLFHFPCAANLYGHCNVGSGEAGGFDRLAEDNSAFFPAQAGEVIWDGRTVYKLAYFGDIIISKPVNKAVYNLLSLCSCFYGGPQGMSKPLAPNVQTSSSSYK